jgi:Bacterial extracellular solute-binding protein
MANSYSIRTPTTRALDARKRDCTGDACDDETGSGGDRPPLRRRQPPGRTVYGWHVAEGRADIFLTYCTNAVAAQKEDSSQQMVALRETLTVSVNYGLTVINGGPPAAQRFADFILSSEGQKLLASHGISPGR